MLLYQSGYQVSVERVVCGSDRGRHGGIEACLVEVRVIHLLLLLLPLLIVSKELSRIGRRILSFFFFFGVCLSLIELVVVDLVGAIFDFESLSNYDTTTAGIPRSCCSCQGRNVR